MSPSVPLCHHQHSAGRRCGSPALRNEQFCYHHHPTRPPVPRQPAAQSIAFELLAVIDRISMHRTISEVMMRLADLSLDTKRAGMILTCLQLTATNMQSVPRSGPGPNTDLDLSDLL
jgi:hypothetical protein